MSRMALREDPELNEDRALSRLIPSFAGLRVLEIGAGDGRITRKFAHAAASVIAIDPKTEDIARLRADLAVVDARAIGIHDLKIAPQSIDVAIFSWSL
jgi:2-polyprenyl-3-methyl-5-hydroxy-6-metoxy-1,4-benzoquinol methylase